MVLIFCIQTFNICLNDETAPQIPMKIPKIRRIKLKIGTNGNGEINSINAISMY